jgi:hypothetical protein
MSIYQQKNGKELLSFVFSHYALETMPPAELVAVFVELFDLENKRLNALQLAYLKGRIEILVRKYKIPTR